MTALRPGPAEAGRHVRAEAGRHVGERRAGRWLFALALVVYLFTAGGSLTTTDAVVTFDVTRSIVAHGSVAMSGNLLGREAERGRDGRYYSPFGIGQSLYNIPFYLAARAAIGVTGVRIGKPDSVPKAVVALGQTVVCAAIVWEFFLLAVVIVGFHPAVLASLTLAFGTILWPYSGFGFNQPLACWTLLAAVRHAVLGTRQARGREMIYAGFWLAASLMTRHEMGLAAIPIAAWLWMDGRPVVAIRVRRLIAFAPGLLIGIGGWLAFNAIRFGNPIETGYLQDATPGFWSPVTSGLAALVASPSASLFLYSPMALAGVIGLVTLARTHDRAAASLLAAIAILFTLFYATLGNWLGGRSYGSRYLVVILPMLAIGWAALLAGLSASARRLAFVIVCLGGAIVQVPGVLIDYAKVSQSESAAHTPFTTEERQWRWDAAPLVLNVRALVRAVPENLSYLTGRAAPPAVSVSADEADRSFSQQFSFSLDLWWLYLFYLRVLPAWGVVVVVGGFLAAAGVIGRRLWISCHTEFAPEPVQPLGGQA